MSIEPERTPSPLQTRKPIDSALDKLKLPRCDAIFGTAQTAEQIPIAFDCFERHLSREAKRMKLAHSRLSPPGGLAHRRSAASLPQHPTLQASTMLLRTAYRTSAADEGKLSLRIIEALCVSTVFRLIERMFATCLFELPSAINCTTRRSRSVSTERTRWGLRR